LYSTLFVFLFCFGWEKSSTMMSPEPVLGAPPLLDEQIDAALDKLDEQEAVIQRWLAEIINKPM
jgi:hypothetical protein